MIDLNPHSCLVGFEICGHFFFPNKKKFIHTVSSQTSSHQNIKKTKKNTAYK